MMEFSLPTMHNALKENQFTLVYQPKYDLFLSRVTGVEALVRWQHPDKGLISPVNFIPTAEKNGFIHQLGHWILEEAITQAVSWREAGQGVSVAINVSPVQIGTEPQVEGFMGTLDELLKNSRAYTTDIQLEVTEGTAVSPSGLVWLELVKSRGIALAIDDFGTGYSSLAYLKEIGAHTLKIDKAFIDNAPSSLSDCLLLEAMIDIGHSFGMVVVVEGAEVEEQVDFLEIVNCNVIQGYYFSKPLPALEVQPLLLKRICPKTQPLVIKKQGST